MQCTQYYSFIVFVMCIILCIVGDADGVQTCLIYKKYNLEQQTGRVDAALIGMDYETTIVKY